MIQRTNKKEKKGDPWMKLELLGTQVPQGTQGRRHSDTRHSVASHSDA